MEEFIKSDLEFNDIVLNNLLIDLRNHFDDRQVNFAHLCKSIYKIWSYCKYNFYKAKDNEYYNSYKLLAKFGLDKKAVFRLKQCYLRFVYDYETDNKLPLYALPKVCLKFEFSDFSPSKLFELLSLSQETVEEVIAKQLITPTMTVKQIRDYINTLKDGSDKADKVIEKTTEDETLEETIPMAYDPTMHYDFDYFKNMSKPQLINNIWELQKEYERLKAQQSKPTKSKSLKSMLVG